MASILALNGCPGSVDHYSMAQSGNVINSKGAFSVVEVVETYLDGRSDVIGDVITRPGAESAWLYGSFEEAIAVADELDDDYRPSSGPWM